MAGIPTQRHLCQAGLTAMTNLRKPAATGRARRASEMGGKARCRPSVNLAENSPNCKLSGTRDAFENWQSLPVISQQVINWLVFQNVPPFAIGSGENPPLKQAESGEITILIFDESGPFDVALWSARNGTLEAHIGAAWHCLHVWYQHDDWCGIYAADALCHCNPHRILTDNQGRVLARVEGAGFYDPLEFSEAYHARR